MAEFLAVDALIAKVIEDATFSGVLLWDKRDTTVPTEQARSSHIQTDGQWLTDAVFFYYCEDRTKSDMHKANCPSSLLYY